MGLLNAEQPQPLIHGGGGWPTAALSWTMALSIIGWFGQLKGHLTHTWIRQLRVVA
jgi:hypothetical protein